MITRFQLCTQPESKGISFVHFKTRIFASILSSNPNLQALKFQIYVKLLNYISNKINK